ncbi:ImmA/IrrE family metallo-endopeptidase [Streptomyces rimosus]|uniref:ImmA/IrrE family metallo-endopeptidase n=1 Tax=Streptomyces rimosus TaxID=1927 RepID=UPI0007C5C664|nr:ImmA/IrrE family metallo-endopeptidase [Streptomyces rimosus]
MKRVQELYEDVLRDLVIPQPFDVDDICAQVSKRRNRPLRLLPMQGMSGSAPCGMWLATGEADYIFYEPNTSRLHSEHIVLHEIGHLLGDHTQNLRTDSSLISRLLPSLNPETVKRVLGRASYTTEQEREAELFASLVRARAGRESSYGEAGGAGVAQAIADAFQYYR